MMGVIQFKIWRDLWENKARTLQVVLIIAMGAFAVGMIITTRNLLIPGMEQIWQASDPATINLYADPRVDDDTITALKSVEGVADVEGSASDSLEWRLSPDDPWSAGRFIARADYEDQKYTKLEILSGNWPQDKFFAIGQGTDTAYGIHEGSQVYIRIGDREHVVTINGILYDPVIQPPSFGGPAQFYATRDRLGDLTGDRNFNLIMAGTTFEYDEAKAQLVADKMQRKLEKQGVDSGGASPTGGRVTDPHKHFFQDPMDGLFTVLQIMAILALILGLFLVYNTITAIIAQQTNQIGIMKAVGAKWWQILLVYLANVLAYGVLALIIAMPLGIIAGWYLNLFLMAAFNAEPGPFIIPGEAIRARGVSRNGFV